MPLVSRLRSHDNVAHLSACFELILHELLLRAQCTVELPQQGPAVPRGPDFLVTTSAQESFYLEATLATGRSRQEESAARRLEAAYSAIDSVDSPDFLLTVLTRGTPSQPVSGKRLKRRIHEWLAGLDYDTISGGSEAAPILHEEHGCRIEIGAVPRDRTRGMANRRAIGARGGGAEYVRTREAIRRSVASKATRYGELDRPYVVAVNAMHSAADEHDVIEALLGSVSVVVPLGPRRPRHRGGTAEPGRGLVWPVRADEHARKRRALN